MSAPLPIDSIQRPDPGQTLLDIQVRTCPGGVIVQLRGELDFTNTHRIEAVLRRLREQRLVYLDLAGLSFLDCAGVDAILAAHERQRRRSDRMILTHAGSRIRRVLELTRADQLLQIGNDTR